MFNKHMELRYDMYNEEIKKDFTSSFIQMCDCGKNFYKLYSYSFYNRDEFIIYENENKNIIFTKKVFFHIKDTYEITKKKFNIDLINNNYNNIIDHLVPHTFYNNNCTIFNKGFKYLLNNLTYNFSFENDNKYLLKLIYWYHNKIENKSNIYNYDKIYSIYTRYADMNDSYYAKVLTEKAKNNHVYVSNYKYFIKYFIKYIIEILKIRTSESVIYFCNTTLKTGDTTTFKCLQLYCPKLTAKIKMYNEIFKFINKRSIEKYSMYYQYLFPTQLNVLIQLNKYKEYSKNKQILKWII